MSRNGKAFLEAISASEAALKDDTLQKRAETAKKHLEELEREADQLWDLFKRALTGD
jgi:hypothetical protein